MEKTLCETCDIEVFKKCKWAHGLKPVAGWKVRKIKLRQDRGRWGSTYIVEECPNYKKEKPRKREPNGLYSDFRPQRYCVICRAELKGDRRKYCSEQCCDENKKRIKHEHYISRKKANE